jgi:hypothetical protein
MNPTAPHSLGNVLEALNDFDCTNTPAGTVESEPQVPGMTAGTTCAAYRQTIIDRAGGATDNNSLGSIWIDDVVGSIIQVLQDRNQLENTFFLFQLDHGQEGKSTLYEQGLRIPKFVHFPQAFPSGKTFGGLVSTIDTAPTILDYAGVTKDSPGYYEMDGRSWRDSVETSSQDADRCVYFELDQDRAIRCGCYKYMYIHDASQSTTMQRAGRFGMASTALDGGELLFDLCGDDGTYETSVNKEALVASNASKLAKLQELSSCLLTKTFPTTLPDYVDCGLNPTQAPVASPAPVVVVPNPTVAPTETPVSPAPVVVVPDPTATPTLSPVSAAPVPDPTSTPSASPVSPAPVVKQVPDPTSTPTTPVTPSPIGVVPDPTSPPTGAPTLAPVTASPILTATDSPVTQVPTTSPPSKEPSELDVDAGRISDEVFDRYVDTTTHILMECGKRDGLPVEGSSCRKYPKTCLFGDQLCSDGQSHPTVICECIDQTWGCSAVTCPSTGRK